MGRVIPVTENFSGRQPGGGESEIKGIELGTRYYLPNPAATKRIEGYEKATRMLDPDEHWKLYQETFPQANEPDRQYWISVDFPGMLARLMKQYTIGRDFRVTARGDGSADEVKRIVDKNDLAKRLRQATESLPSLGDAVFRVDVENGKDDQPQAVIRYVRPHNFHPVFDPMDGERTVGAYLSWVFRVDEGQVVSGMENGQPVQWGDARTQRMVVLREVHAPAEEGEESGTVKYKLNKWDGKYLGDALQVRSLFPDLEDHETGIKDVPLVHVGYQVRAGEYWGNSEFLRIQRIFLALENRLSQEDEVLEKHARPKLIVGPGVLDEETKANLADFDVIEIDPDVMEKAVKPEYLTWDMQVGGIKHEIEKLEEYLFMTTETSPASFGLERDGSQVESARALKFKAHRTVNKVDDLRDEWEPGVKKLLELSQERELSEGAEYELVETAVDFGEAIVEDPTEEVVNYSTLKGAHLVSRKRALEDLHRLTPTEAEREDEAILQDMVDESAAQAQSLGIGPAGAANLPEVAPAAGTVGTGAQVPAETPGTPAGETGLGIAEDIQKTLLNGAQVTAMVNIVSTVAAGQLPRDAGLNILQTAFGITEQEAKDIMGNAGLEPDVTVVEIPETTAKPPVVPGAEGEVVT